MLPRQYIFSALPQKKTGHYVYQTVKERTLSDIYHSHDFYEVCVILKGSCQQLVNDVVCELQQGDALIFVPLDAHRFTWQSDDLEQIGLSVHSEEFVRLAKAFDVTLPSTGGGEIHRLDCSCRLDDIIRQCEQMRASETEEWNCRLLLSAILAILAADQAGRGSAPPPVIARAVEALHQEENMRRGLSALVELTRYSYPHLFRLIREHYRMTPHQLLLKIRMEYCYDRLLFTEDLVEEIARSVGYESTSHFQQLFRSYHGITPVALRRQNKDVFTV